MALTNGNIKALLTIHEAEFITTPPTVILALIFDFCVKTRFISILQSTPESIAIIDKKILLYIYVFAQLDFYIVRTM